MSRTALGILAGGLIILGIISLIGYSAGWTSMYVPVFLSWVEIIVGIVCLIIASADTK